MSNPHERRPSTSMSMVRVGGHDYPMVSVHNCRTCQSPHRQFIENELIIGRSYSAIGRELQKMPVGSLPHPSDEAIANHVRQGHLPTPASTRRQIVDRRAEQLGAAIAGKDDLADYVVVNEMVVKRGFERLMSGEIEPSMGDLMQALQFQHKIESTSDEGYDIEAYQEAMFIHLEVARQHMPPEVFQRYGQALNRNPILKALAAKAAGRDVVQGEAHEVPEGAEQQE
jgi:hypothetical protein